MPKKLEEHLKNEVKTNPKYKNLSEEKKNAIIYGVMRRQGWVPGEGQESLGSSLTREDQVIVEKLFQELFGELK